MAASLVVSQDEVGGGKGGDAADFDFEIIGCIAGHIAAQQNVIAARDIPQRIGPCCLCIEDEGLLAGQIFIGIALLPNLGPPRTGVSRLFAQGDKLVTPLIS